MNPEINYHPYISSPLVPIFSKIYPGTQPTYLKSILILFSHLRLDLSNGLFPSGFPTKTLYAFLDCSIRATCPAHLSRLDLRLLIMLGEAYNSCSSAARCWATCWTARVWSQVSEGWRFIYVLWASEIGGDWCHQEKNGRSKLSTRPWLSMGHSAGNDDDDDVAQQYATFSIFL